MNPQGVYELATTVISGSIDEKYIPLFNAWTQKLNKIERSAQLDSEQCKLVQLYRTLLGEIAIGPFEFPSGPFVNYPPEGDLVPIEKLPSAAYLQSVLRHREFVREQKKAAAGADDSKLNGGYEPKLRIRTLSNPLPDDSSDFNAYEDPEEIAKVIARSQGQTVQEFVGAISRYTRDSGQAMEAAMKADATNFRDYIENISSQYVKDLTEVLDEQQNRELQEIRRDIDKWQTELSNLKKRIREMIPTFDIDLYRKDPNYIRKLFSFNVPGFSPEEDSYRKFKEESSDRLKAINEMLKNVMQCNNQAKEDLANINESLTQFQNDEEEKQKNLMNCLRCDINEFMKLKEERDQLSKEYNCILAQMEEDMCD